MLTLAGLGVAGYLTYVHYAGIKPICTAGGSCEKVQTSVYSRARGRTGRALGPARLYRDLGFCSRRESETTRFATTALALVGFAFSAYLTYRELYSIHAVCEWCASSAVILTVMAPLSVWRFLRVVPGRPASQRADTHESAVPGSSAS